MASAIASFRSNVLQESTNSQPKTKGAAPAKKKISVTSLIDTTEVQASPVRPKKNAASATPKEKSNRVQNPPPIAVARRNARERNRVKQVNNGFATLRQHIPNEIAEIYENATNNNRTANKKLSKVETLRMAVEYIRSLENLLSIDSSDANNVSLASFPSPASSAESFQNNSSYERAYFEDDSNPATPLPPVTTHHYSRIPGTNAFQLIPVTINSTGYEDEENVHPLTPNSDELYVNSVEYVSYEMKYAPSVEEQLAYHQAQLMNGECVESDVGDVGDVGGVPKQEPIHVDDDDDDSMDDVMTWWETEGRHEDEES